MSRSNYSDDGDGGWYQIMWRGAVASAIRGKRGQAFLRELLATLDAMPEKKLIPERLAEGDQVCALGSVGRARGIDMSKLDPENYDQLAKTFDISAALVREIEYENDGGEYDYLRPPTPEKRWENVRNWVAENIKP